MIFMSKFLKLNAPDLVKGAIVSAITGFITIIGASVYAGKMPTIVEWQLSGTVALVSALGYLSKNLLTNSKGQPFKVEPKV